MEQTDPTKPIDQDAIDKAIVKLCEQYPGKFDVLPYMEFVEDTDYWGPIAYNHIDKVSVYNPMHLDVFTLPSTLAFIALMVSGPYIGDIEKLDTDRDRHLYNCACHVHILRELRKIGDFSLPGNAVIDFGLADEGQTVDELFKQLQNMGVDNDTLYDEDGNVIYNDVETEQMEYDDE
jgi:hypothetical protein